MSSETSWAQYRHRVQTGRSNFTWRRSIPRRSNCNNNNYSVGPGAGPGRSRYFYSNNSFGHFLLRHPRPRLPWHIHPQNRHCESRDVAFPNPDFFSHHRFQDSNFANRSDRSFLSFDSSGETKDSSPSVLMPMPFSNNETDGLIKFNRFSDSSALQRQCIVSSVQGDIICSQPRNDLNLPISLDPLPQFEAPVESLESIPLPPTPFPPETSSLSPSPSKAVGVESEQIANISLKLKSADTKNEIPSQEVNLSAAIDYTKSEVVSNKNGLGPIGSDWYKTFYWRFWAGKPGTNRVGELKPCDIFDLNDSDDSEQEITQRNENMKNFKSLPTSKIVDSSNPEHNLKLRHGRVQSVKFLSEENAGNNGGAGRTPKIATVAFIDIRSATKAYRNVRSISGKEIEIGYHEPGTVPSASRCPPQPLQSLTQGELSSNLSGTPVTPQGNVIQNIAGGGPGANNNCIPSSPAAGMYRQQRFQHGQSEDSSSHFYDQPKSFSRGRGDGHGFHGGRGRRDTRPPFHNRHSFTADNRHSCNRNYRPQWSYPPSEGRYAPPAHSEVDERPPVPPATPHPPISEPSSKGSRRPESPASSVSSRNVPTKRHRSRSVSESGSSDRGSSAGSRSRSGSRSSVSTSVSSRSRSPPHHTSSGHCPRGGVSSGRFHQNSFSRQRYSRSRVVSRSSDSRVRHSSRSPMAASPSSSTSSSSSPHRKIAAPHSPSHSPSSSKSYSPSRNIGGSHHHHHNHHHHHRRIPNFADLHAAIKIRDLPLRSTDSSLKDGLYHEYKKHGKVSWVRIMGSGPERFAIVCFKSAEHAARAVSLSQDKQFFGCTIQVTPCNHGKGDEIVGLQVEENRVVGEEEPASVGYPTRTVLITGLDAGVTTTELKAAFHQYGDIVQINIRKQGTATHAVCEFVDIESAIRAQWGRHVFKSREARISFYKNPTSNSLLLDGTAGVDEKQVYGHCCQYGAIKRVVMDPKRFLALVQFEEISSAQTAIRQLRSWVIKGKHLQVDFASHEVIRRFLERVSNGQINTTEILSPNLHGPSSPSIGNSVIVAKDSAAVRRFRNQLDEDDQNYRGIMEMDGFKLRKTVKGSDRSASSEKLQDQISMHGSNTAEFLNTPDNVTFPKDTDVNSRLRSGYTSPVSPDAEHSVTEARRLSEPMSGKCNSRSKIDLNCHETDSAIVTSSSDVIVGEKSESHTNHGSSSSSLNGDEKLSSLELCGARRKSLTNEVSHSAIVTVDGVSSTSPEPKTETVRKASPDPGIGMPESVTRFSDETHIFSGGLADPRKKANDCKIRRSSADSGNSTGVVSSHMHSTSGAPSSYSSLTQLQASTANINVSADENESDDRPGTPLCDENPECFVTSDDPVSLKSSRSQPFSFNLKSDPLSLPLPEFALQRQRANSNASSKEFPSSSVRLSRSSSETNLQSPIKSPISSVPDIPSSVGVPMSTSSVCEVDVMTPTHEHSSPSFSSSTNASWKDDSINTKVTNPRFSSLSNHDHRISDAKSKDFKSVDSHSECDKSEHSSSSDPQPENRPDNAIESPNSETGSSSPTSSPTSVTLDQRIQKCCETYDRWNGNRANLNSNQSLQPSPNLTRLNSSSVDEIAAGENVNSKILTADLAFETTSSCRFALSKHKFLDLDELRHQPSDIGRSVLARRSVFDEDTKRLENYGEKYEAKAALSSVVSSNLRMIALQRSTSTASSSSASSLSSNVWLTASPSTPLTPPATSVFNSNTNPPSSSLQSSVRLQTSTVLGPVSSGVVSSPTKNSFPQCAFQGNANSQQKLKDLNLNQPQGSVSKSLKLDPTSKAHDNPSPNTQTPPHNASQPQKRHSVQPSVEDSKPVLLLKIPENVDNIKSMASPKLAPNNVVPPSPQLSHSVASTSKSSHVSNNPSALPPMVHQGLPRAVERSLSLDSKKATSTSTNNSACWNSTSANPSQCNAGSFGNANHSLFSNPLDISASTGSVARRSSVDSHTSTSVGKSNDSSSSHQQSAEKAPDLPVNKVKEPSAIHSKSTIVIKNPIKCTFSSIANNLVSVSDKTLRSNSSVNENSPKKQLQLHKPELDFIKDEVMEIRPIPQETTVAVVATEQNPFIQTRSDSVGSSSTKETSKKEKDKKRRSSGSSPPVASLNVNSVYLTPTRIEPMATTTQQSSSRDRISSVKGSEDRKEKKEKEKDSKSTGESNGKSSDSLKADGASSSNSSQRKSEDKKDKKDKKDTNREKDSAEHSSSNWKESHSQHGHRKDKESSGKRKRRLSSQETDPDLKRSKVEKDKDTFDSTHYESPHHRLKSTSSNERRESRDSSSSTKDKLKEKETSRTSSVSQSSEISLNKEKEKEDNKTKENHHKSKEKSSSGSSKDKHQQHHSEKLRTPSESRTNHLSGKVEQHTTKDKERQKKDKVSPGKENLKGSSKHHTHGSSHHSTCSSKSKDISSTGKTKIPIKERTKSQGEKRHSLVDSESEGAQSQLHIHAVSVSGETPSRSDHHAYDRVKSEKHEKRDSSGKRDRHRSGGDNPSTSGGSDKSKNKEQRRKKKFVIEETESSDSDDEEKKKHHSIFEVVVDEYVSMYDKVKARSNRACKQTTPVQHDESKKQDKIKDQFRQLKQSSRAKKIDKKRSTSVDESNKSMEHTSSDEGSQVDISMADLDDVKEDMEPHELKPRDQIFTQSSDEEDHVDRLSKSTSRKLKNNKSSSSVEKLNKKKGRKSEKTSPIGTTLFQVSASSIFSNSDDDSNASSSHRHEPQKKKKRLSMKSNSGSEKIPAAFDAKSSEDSGSDSEDACRRKSVQSSRLKTQVQSKQTIAESQNQKKLQANDVYSDSDSSVISSGPVILTRKPIVPVPLVSTKSKSKEKLSKQKSMRKSLFESSDSSDVDVKPPPIQETRKEKSRECNKLKKEKDKDSKSSRKKHRVYSSSTSNSLKSGKSSKKQRVSSGDGSFEISTHGLSKRESGSTMEDLLFGPMTSSSNSDLESKRHQELERPKTPTIVIDTKTPDDVAVVSKRSKNRKASRSLSPCSSVDINLDHGETTRAHATVSVPKSVSTSSEKRKKKHHKEKRSKRQDNEEQSARSSKSAVVDAKSVDYDSLFNSPQHSPAVEMEVKPDSPVPCIKEEPIFNASNPPLLFSSDTPQNDPKTNISSIKPQDSDEPEIAKPIQQSGMFSSDDDDDDDDKLKIDINNIASSDEPGLDLVIDGSGTDDGNFREKLQREEEEKKLHSLFEQDKAIESIVLLERKSPVLNPVADDEVIKDEIPKDCTAISQEETEDAVAALLVTLEGDDDLDEASNTAKAPVVSTVPTSIHSPPTIRIIEESNNVAETSNINAGVISSNIQACIDRVAQPDKEPVSSWSLDLPSKSPIIPSSESSPHRNGPNVDDVTNIDIEIPKTPDIQSRKASIDSCSSSVGERNEESKKPARRASSQVKSRQGSSELEQEGGGNSSADIYEFHDSDEEKHGRKTHLVHARQTPPVPTSISKSPLTSPSLPASSVTVSDAEVNPPPIIAPIPIVPSSLPSPIIQPAIQVESVVPVVQTPVAVSQISKTDVQPEIAPANVVAATTTLTTSKTPTPPSPVLMPVVPPVQTPPTPVVSVATSVVKTPPPVSSVVTRSTIDETIENVIRMAQMQSSMPEAEVPALTITSVKTTGPRSRSRSKDTPVEDSTVSITKVMSRPENSPRSAGFQPHVTTLTHVGMSHSNNNRPKSEKEDSISGKEGNSEGGAGLETLIDPQTGILMPMMRQSDEGQYVPIVGQDQPVLPKIQQPQFSVPSFQVKHDEPSKGTEREANRPSSVERHTLPQAYVPTPNQKNEGLAAMFAQQHVLQQAHMSPNSYGIMQNTNISKPLLQPRVSLSSPIQHHIVTTGEGTVQKNSNVVYTSSGMFQNQKPPSIITTSGAAGPTTGSNMQMSSQPPTILSEMIPHSGMPLQHPGNVPMGRTVFVTNQQQITQQNNYPFAVISRASEAGAPRPLLRQVNMPIAQPSHPTVSKAMSQPTGGQVQPELVNFQIPSATTITKVNSGQDDNVQRKNVAMGHPGMVLSSTVTSHGNMGQTGPVRAVTTSPSAGLSMTQKQHQQHQQQTELFRRSAEGLIRVGSNDETNTIMGRSQDPIGLAQPPRVDITGSIVQAAAASPKAGRVPLQHEQLPNVSTQSRIQQHPVPYDSPSMGGDVRNILSHSRSPADSPHYGPPPQSHQQLYHSPHYLSGNGSNSGNNMPPTSTYNIRSGMLDKTQQPEFKPMTAEMKGNSNLVGPDRNRGLQNVPQHALPHLQSPHPSDQRNADSPLVTSLYGSQRPMYPPPSPAHQSLSRQTFRILYSEPVERQASNSPSYTNSYATAAAVAAAASEVDVSRVLSPYNSPDLAVARRSYSPPTTNHSRFSGAQPMTTAEAPSSNERLLRQLHVQTPPHASPVPPQSDSLLHLLQRYPIMWQGLLALKNDNAACQMHFVSGNVSVARDCLPSNPDGSMPPLRISQRMRLEQTQLEGVARKMQLEPEHCILLALPCGRDHLDVLQHSTNLRNGFITYLQLKQAAGIVNICHPTTQQPAYVIHIFPSCDFANENLARIAPDLLHGVADIAHLLIVIATV